MRVVKAPYEWEQEEGEISIFLGGSIEMGTAEDWQAVITDHFKSEKNILILNPRRDHWNPNLEQKKKNEEFYEQVTWELNAQDNADINIYYFVPNTKSPITLLELGCYGITSNSIVYCPDGYWRKGNVDIFCEWNDIDVYSDLPSFFDALDDAVGTIMAF